MVTQSDLDCAHQALDDCLDKLESVMHRLYEAQAMTLDQRRDLAKEIEAFLRCYDR